MNEQSVEAVKNTLKAIVDEFKAETISQLIDMMPQAKHFVTLAVLQYEQLWKEIEVMVDTSIKNRDPYEVLMTVQDILSEKHEHLLYQLGNTIRKAIAGIN